MTSDTMEACYEGGANDGCRPDRSGGGLQTASARAYLVRSLPQAPHLVGARLGHSPPVHFHYSFLAIAMVSCICSTGTIVLS